MRAILEFLVLPTQVSAFERKYLERVNTLALIFFALHVPLFVGIAYANDTGPGLALVLTLAVLAGPALARAALTNPRHTSIVHGISAMLMGGLLVHFGEGPVQIEMHFYFFALIAMSAVFGNPLVIVAAAVTVALHHLIVWLVLPRSVFNYEAEWWVVAVHALFVVLESVATCFIARSFFDNVIGLEKIVQARTTELDARNRDMRLLLDNVQQGFLTIDRGGKIAQERSATVDTWFGSPAGSSWFEYLASISPSFAERSRLGWDQVTEGFLPAEVALAQMPAALSLGSRHFQFEYRPIGREPSEDFLVIVTDVTSELQRENLESEQRETMALFERLLNDRGGVQDFFDDGTHMLALLTRSTSQDLTLVKRLIHTLKGNAACTGLHSIAELCHALEDSMSETGALPPPEAYEQLRTRWSRLQGDLTKLSGNREKVTEIDDAQFAELEAAARSGESGPALVQRIRALRLEAASKRLKHFGEQATRIAERLDKDIEVKIEDQGVRLDHARWGRFWSSFIHAIRNAIDHGIETREERVTAGKSAQGKLTLRTRMERDALVVEIADDGRGIDWNRIADRARRAGIPSETAADLERALFAEGISTADTVTDLSGRGVGMGALLAATEELGGKLSVDTDAQRGTTLRFVFPPRVLRSIASEFPARAAS